MPRGEKLAGKRVLFSSTNQPKNRGRKPKLYTLAKRGFGLGADDYKEVVGFLMQCTKVEIEKIQADPSTPMWVVTICRALHMDASKGSTKTLQELTERLFGKSPQSIDVTSKGKEIAPEPIFINRCESREDIKEDADGGEIS